MFRQAKQTETLSHILAVLLALVPALLNCGILIYLFFFLPRSKTTHIFASFIISLFLWQAYDVVARTVIDLELMRFWDRVLGISWFATAPLSLHFAITFTSKKKQQPAYIPALIYFPFLAFYLLFVGNTTPVTFIDHDFWGYINTPRPGSMDNVHRHAISVVVLLALLILFRYVARMNSESQFRRKRQALLIAVGLFIPTLQGTITQVMLPAYFQMEVPITSTVLTVFSFSIIYGLSRYRMFNISDSLDVEGILENFSNMIWITTVEGDIIYRNAFAAKRLNLPDGEEIWKLDNILSPDQRSRFQLGVINPCLNGQPCTDFEVQLTARNGQFYEVLISSEVINNNGVIQGILVIAHDITQHKRQLAAIADQNRKLSDIAWAQSHLVRSPLARILGLIKIMKLPNTDDKDKDLYLDHLEASANELDHVIQDMVDIGYPLTDRLGNPGTRSESANSDINPA